MERRVTISPISVYFYEESSKWYSHPERKREGKGLPNAGTGSKAIRSCQAEPFRVPAQCLLFLEERRANK
jgi:hypothetical protein